MGRAVGALLVGDGRPVTQMIVATYEEPLARRLNETVDDTVIRYLDRTRRQALAGQIDGSAPKCRSTSLGARSGSGAA